MKKNRMMRLASILLVCVLLTTSVISGTFAKYTTSVESQDSARVAKWGFEPVAMDITGLFKNVYAMTDKPTFATNSVDSKVDVIAPGTAGSAQFAFAYDEKNGINAPEVAYTFEVSTDGSECAESIQKNASIQWALDSTKNEGDWGSWTDLIKKIQALDGNAYGPANCNPNTLPAGFGINDNTHTIYWRWIFTTGEGSNKLDTEMGNADELANVKLKITITATQVD